MFWRKFFEKFFCPVFHGGSSLRKISKNFQNSKNAQNRSQKCPNVFWTCFGVIFWKIFFAQCSMEGRVFEKIQKKSKKFQNSKNAQNRSQKCPNVFWTYFEVIFLKKKFLPSVPWRVESWSHLPMHWRTYTLDFCRKRNSISIQWLGHPNPNHVLLHHRKITSLRTLVGSVRYLITLLEYSLFYYIVKLYPTFLHCWPMPNRNTLLRLVRYTLSYYIAKHFPNTNTLLSYAQS